MAHVAFNTILRGTGSHVFCSSSGPQGPKSTGSYCTGILSAVNNVKNIVRMITTLCVLKQCRILFTYLHSAMTGPSETLLP